MSSSKEAAELPINSEPSAETKESELTADVSQDNFEPQECSARQENENSANLSAEVLAHRKSIETLQQELYNLKEAVSCSRTRESRGTESWKGDALMFCRHENYSQPCTQSKSPETYMHGEEDKNHHSVFEMEKKIESLESELRRVTDLCTARVQESVELLHSKDVELERLEAELHRTIWKSPNDTRLVNYCAGQEKTSESRTAERITELARKVLQANRDRERQEARIQELQCTLHNLEQDRNLLLKRLREHEKKLEDSLSERSTERNHFENTLKEAHRELHIARETYQKFAEFFFKTGEKSLSASNPTQHSEHKPVTSDLSATESSRVNREASSSPSKANPSEISTEKLIMMQNEEGCIDFQEPNARSKVHLPPNHNRIEHDAYSPSSVLREQRRYQQEIQALQEKYQQSIDRITTDLKARMLSQQELRDAEIARLQREVHSVQCERDTALQESIQSQIELQALRGKFLELEKKAAENEREASNKKLVTEQLKDEREAHRSTLMNLAQQKISFEKEIKDLKQQVSELKFQTNSP